LFFYKLASIVLVEFEVVGSLCSITFGIINNPFQFISKTRKTYEFNPRLFISAFLQKPNIMK